jgi:MoaE-MoaD fusion protein
VVRILYFAACREPAGTSSEELDVGGRRVDDVVRAIVEKHPGLSKIAPRCRVAVNQSFARGDDVVPDGAEVALVPPVAGG